MRGRGFSVAVTVLWRDHAGAATDLPTSPPREESLHCSPMHGTVQVTVVGFKLCQEVARESDRSWRMEDSGWVSETLLV